jgi:hypothetical protein
VAKTRSTKVCLPPDPVATADAVPVAAGVAPLAVPVPCRTWVAYRWLPVELRLAAFGLAGAASSIRVLMRNGIEEGT